MVLATIETATHSHSIGTKVLSRLYDVKRHCRTDFLLIVATCMSTVLLTWNQCCIQLIISLHPMTNHMNSRKPLRKKDVMTKAGYRYAVRLIDAIIRLIFFFNLALWSLLGRSWQTKKDNCIPLDAHWTKSQTVSNHAKLFINPHVDLALSLAAMRYRCRTRVCLDSSSRQKETFRCIVEPSKWPETRDSALPAEQRRWLGFLQLCTKASFHLDIC